MKKILAVVAEFCLFLLLNLVGGIFYHPFHLQTQLAATSLGSRSFVWDGVLLMLAAWLILLLIAVARKRLPATATRATIALALAAAAGFLLKVGFMTVER